MKKIYIFSAGPGGRDVLRLIEDINDVSPTWEVMGFVENDEELIGTVIDDLNVFSLNDVPKSSDFYAICGVQDPYLRRRIVYNEISPKGYNLATLVHPNIVKAKDFSRSFSVEDMHCYLYQSNDSCIQQWTTSKAQIYSNESLPANALYWLS